MILVGQLDSPYVRRVAVSLRLLGFEYEPDERSVFGDFESMRETNPLARIPSLILDTGETLIDSNAILDWLDDRAGDGALLPRAGAARRAALQRIALATGAIDKIGGAVYERMIRPKRFFWQDWHDRCRTQGLGAIEALAGLDWDGEAVDQPAITTVCMLRFVEMADPEAVAPGRFADLDALRDRCEALPAFRATWPPDYVVPVNG